MAIDLRKNDMKFSHGYCSVYDKVLASEKSCMSCSEFPYIFKECLTCPTVLSNIQKI